MTPPSPATPVIEPADTPGRYRVTFLWEAASADERAVVLINTVTDRDRHAGDITGHVMTPLPGTGLLHLTYELDADLRASYQILPCTTLPGTDRDSWLKARRAALPDPRNPRTVPSSPDRHPSSLLELPQAPPQPYRDARPGVPQGRVTEAGVAGRRVWVHTPPEHGTGPYPVVVLLDGEMWAGRIGPTVDNLIADGHLPPAVVLMPDSVDRSTRHRELACHEPFVRFLAGELLPWAEREWQASADPGLTVIAGQSFGGLTASYAAFVAPERFGNVLSQSGSYWWSEADPEWLTGRYARAPRLPVRFHVEAGALEWMLVRENRRFAHTLAAQGYEVSFTEYNGGHDPACWLGGLATGLTTLAAGWL